MKFPIHKNIARMFLIALILFSVPIIYGEADVQENTIIVPGKDFYASLNAIVFFQRDSYFDSLKEKLINARGIFLSIDQVERYSKKYRVICSDEESVKYGFKIYYYLYFSDRNFIDSMEKGEPYHFKGIIVGWTPLDSQRKEFIIEINLEEISRDR